jgi:hypothetical protein
MSITRLSGGLTPADGSDPRTFPTIFNATADEIESQGSAIVDLENGVVGGTAVYRYADTIYYTSNGTFVKADYPWLRAIRVKVQGGGGGGGGCGATAGGEFSFGSGGGGGSYSESFITDIAGLNASVTVTRGAGGGGGVGVAGGTTGGASSFGSLVTAPGGLGGGAGGAAPFVYARQTAASGALGVGDFSVQGSSVGINSGFLVSQVSNTPGGSSFLGSAGPSSLGAGQNGGAGGVFGGGGAGAANSESETAKNGGAGANGIVIVELYA